MRGNTYHIFNDFLGPTKFGDNLIIGQSSQVGVAICMDGNLMSGHILVSQGLRKFDNSRSHHKESRLQVVCVEIVE